MSNSSSNLPARRKKFSARDIFAPFGVYALLIFMALLVLTPIVWIIGASFNPMSSLLSATAFPENPTVLHYVKLIKETKFVYWYANTLKIALINMAISVVLTSMTSYVFSRFRFKGKRAGLLSILILQMFPSFMGMMATYNILWQLNLLDTHFGLILTYAAGQVPYNTWLVKGYLANIPRSLDEAAKLDGASNLRIFTQIVLPLMKPILIFVALSQFITPWMDFIFPRMILSSPEKKTLAIGLYDMINANTNNNFTTFPAAAIRAASPPPSLSAGLQKSLTNGLTAGANTS